MTGPTRRWWDQRPAPIYVETFIRADLERVWELTQDTDSHPRWDLRFSAIVATGTTAEGAWRFRYELHLPLHRICGTGISLGERRRPDGTRTSALRFTTPDRLSPLGDGRGTGATSPPRTGCGSSPATTTGPAGVGSLTRSACGRSSAG